MNKTMIRFITAMLVMVMALACFAGCQDPVDPVGGEDTTDGAAAEVTDAPAGEQTEAPELTLEEILGFEIPQLNSQFNILHMTEGTLSQYIYADSFDGDEVAVEVYERNLTLEEDMKVELNFIDSLGDWGTRGNDKKFIETAVQSGANDYDLVFGTNVAMATMMYSGLFYNLCDVESINFDHTWWMPDTVETYGIGGDHIYGLMGDITHSYYGQLGFMALNTTLAENFGVEAQFGNLYDIVYNGKWTIDKMIEVGAAYGQDNGDGNMVFGDDVFGCVTMNVPSRLFLFAFDMELITPNETGDGVVIPTALDEKAISAYEKLYSVFPKNGSGTEPNIIGIESPTTARVAFSEDKVLMFTASFTDLGTEEIRNMTSEYMILPLPKYDENQDDYITPIATLATMALIPLTAVDEENSAMFLEYMGYLGQKDITPVYIEQTLKLKYASNPQVMEMVQYIVDRSAFTLTQAMIWNCESGYFRNVYAFGPLNCVGSPNVASYYSGYRRVWQKNLDNLCEDLQ